MNGLTEDLLNAAAREIETQWEARKGNLSYFVGMVEGMRLTPKDLDNYLTEHGDTCPECVNHVFASIVYEDFLSKEKGGES